MAVIEIAAFSLVDGADMEAFLAADRAVQTEFIPNRSGFLRRTTARNDRGAWAVITLWASEDDADATAAAADGDPVVAEFRSFVDPGTFRENRFTTLD